MRQRTHHTIAFASAALFGSALLIGACADEPPAPKSCFTLPSTSAIGGGGGEGGDGGDGGNGGGGEGGDGGEGGSVETWKIDCLKGCEKADEQCGFGAVCGSIGVDCDATPTAEQVELQCMFSCLALDTTTCTDIGRWLSPTEVPTAPNAFLQCLSGCPDIARLARIGCIHCVSNTPFITNPPFFPHGFCGAELNACLGAPSCYDWLVECVFKDPDLEISGMRKCDQLYFDALKSNSSLTDVLSPLYSCMCDSIPLTGAPQFTFGGTGECSDVCAGSMAPASAVDGDNQAICQ
jgi:hypothetical protein